jgi:hypothetical protein
MQFMKGRLPARKISLCTLLIYSFEEDDPRIGAEPNFYFTQEDLLFKWCKKNGCHWNVARPSAIIGAVNDAAMNVVHPIGLYAVIQKALGQKLIFPGDIAAWDQLQDQSTAFLNAYLEEWAVLNPEAKDEAFNAGDGSTFTWGKFWPKLAKYYGLEYSIPDGSAKYKEVVSPFGAGPRSYGPPVVVRYTYTMAEWARQPEVREAYAKIAKKHGLDPHVIDQSDRIFGFADTLVLAPSSATFSYDKLRKFGFMGAVNSTEAFFATIREFEDMKMLPKPNEL